MTDFPAKIKCQTVDRKLSDTVADLGAFQEQSFCLAKEMNCSCTEGKPTTLLSVV